MKTAHKSIFGYEKLPISPDLQKFFTDYATWIECGMPEGAVFDKDDYICACLNKWLIKNEAKHSVKFKEGHNPVYSEFIIIRRKLFRERSLFPFQVYEGNTPKTTGINNPARKDFILTYGKI